MPERTVRAVLARNGLSRLPRPDAEEPANRYERPAPGELVHIDVKKLGRIGREVTGPQSHGRMFRHRQVACVPLADAPGAPVAVATLAHRRGSLAPAFAELAIETASRLRSFLEQPLGRRASGWSAHGDASEGASGDAG